MPRFEISEDSNIFARDASKHSPSWIDKAVLGHTEECAGLASKNIAIYILNINLNLLSGVLKSIIHVCLQENLIPPQPHIERLDQQIDFVGNKLVAHQRPVPFIRRDKPRHIGISSFGLSGTLAHIILGDVPDHFTAYSQQGTSSLKIFLLSAANQASYQSLLRRLANYTTSPAALDDDFGSICRTSQLGRDHHAFRRAWHVGNLSTLTKILFDELENPHPHHTKKAPKIGLYFGLPTTGTPHTPDCTLFHDLQSEFATIPHESPVEFLTEQLVLSNMLRRIGCDVSAVGGEGLAELGAGIFANILSSRSVFSECESGSSMRSLFVVRGTKEKVREALTQWPPSKLALRGSISLNVSLLEGDAAAAHDLVALGGFELLEEITLPSSGPLIHSSSPASVTYVSSVLGDVLEADILARPSYWSNISTNTNYTIDGTSALTTLAAHCDIIVVLGGRSNWYPDSLQTHAHAEDTPIIHMGGGTNCIEKELARLYERGATMNWSEFGVDGLRAYLPAYEIA